jgi:glycogen synthase
MNDYFLDRPVIPPAIRQEIKEKYYHGQTMSIINSPSPQLYPETCPYLPVKFSPDDDIFRAKRLSLVEFQKQTGLVVNPNAILLYWPSRLDPSQKGIELLEHIAQRFAVIHGDVQIAVVGSGVGNDRTHEDIMGRIAWASRGKITYQRFSEGISLLGYAAAHDVFGASLYEPCGQIDQIGNLYGATATNRDTGGYHDKIHELDIDHLLRSEGNGFLFRDYDPGGLWYGLEKSVRFHRLPAAVREPVIRRIMRDTRRKYDLSVMVDAYVQAYERLNHNEPLA